MKEKFPSIGWIIPFSDLGSLLSDNRDRVEYSYQFYMTLQLVNIKEEYTTAQFIEVSLSTF